MPFNFHVGLPGPFSYTRRIGGRGRSNRVTVTELRAQSRAADLLPEDQLRTRNGVDWIIAGAFALLMVLIGTAWSVGAGALVLVVVGLRHRARTRKRRQQH